VRTTISEKGPQPNFNNEEGSSIDNSPSNTSSGLERGHSLKVRREHQYPRSSSSRLVGPPGPTDPIATRLRPASFYSKINSFWRPTPTPQQSLTNTSSQRRPVLVGDLTVFFMILIVDWPSGNQNRVSERTPELNVFLSAPLRLWLQNYLIFSCFQYWMAKPSPTTHS